MKNPHNHISDIDTLIKLKEAAIQKEVKEVKELKDVEITSDKKGRKTIKYKYLEDFVDEDTGEVVSVERETVLVKNDVYLSYEYSNYHRKKSSFDRRIDKILKESKKKLII